MTTARKVVIKRASHKGAKSAKKDQKNKSSVFFALLAPLREVFFF
jgi:hypothetical protein